MSTADLKYGFIWVQQPIKWIILLTDFTDEQNNLSREQENVDLVLKDGSREKALNYNSAAVLSEKGH